MSESTQTAIGLGIILALLVGFLSGAWVGTYTMRLEAVKYNHAEWLSNRDGHTWRWKMEDGCQE